MNFGSFSLSDKSCKRKLIFVVHVNVVINLQYIRIIIVFLQYVGCCINVPTMHTIVKRTQFFSLNI